jgi:DNA-binding PadR family transcriptional regulator
VTWVVGTSDKPLSLAEWAVLGLLGCEPLHAFAIVKTLAPAGELGRIWSVPTPVVYRAVNNLRQQTLIDNLGEERSEAGPPRVRLGITDSGRQALVTWLRTPVGHLRDVRAELMLKLALLWRLGLPADELIAAQVRTFEPVLAGLEARLAAGGGAAFDVTLATWRLEQARAVLGFLRHLRSRVTVQPRRVARSAARGQGVGG